MYHIDFSTRPEVVAAKNAGSRPVPAVPRRALQGRIGAIDPAGWPRGSRPVAVLRQVGLAVRSAAFVLWRRS
ncbi:hypothetical protein Daura_21880 [Dactylosporangium aurantiacum]|uniref:Uncharacterized protein n=1 Tax=Dactylosporangium aurantiacum TaxID=35754 RepID=A0A9Q9MRK6_9ACTN|nr:hypothetical protein [Dactylosporangium aurantiacum]MDG6110414.1 hypothetical protein [Dactylosporangium aurantiacum]UWZ58587.1 hypothetical protein Daura_21880 [Dactylosporangium aurantiacum]